MAMQATDRTRLWYLRFSTILWFLAGVVFLISFPLVLQASPLILLGILVLALILGAACAWLIAKLSGKSRFRHIWLKATVAIAFILTAITASPIYYAAIITQVSPAMVPQATLTDGRKTIVFQGMQHVATEVFYKSVIYDLEDALSRGSVAYYEGFKPSTPANDQWFQKLVTGGADLGNAYRELGEVCGLKFQSAYFGLLGRDALEHPTAHIVADVDTAQLRAEYDRLMRTDPAFAAAMRERASAATSSSSDGFEKIVTFLRRGSEGQREIAGTLCRGFMTFSTRHSRNSGSVDEMNKLILDYRNRVLAAALLAEPRRRINVTYGAEHLGGVMALLKKANPRWRVVSVKWTRTIDSPEKLTGTL
ncbi:MAG: hypothetical protein ABW169_12065 [Sphingobium sp.]